MPILEVKKIVFDVIRGPNHDVNFSKILLVDDFLK